MHSWKTFDICRTLIPVISEALSVGLGIVSSKLVVNYVFIYICFLNKLYW